MFIEKKNEISHKEPPMISFTGATKVRTMQFFTSLIALFCRRKNIHMNELEVSKLALYRKLKQSVLLLPTRFDSQFECSEI